MDMTDAERLARFDVSHTNWHRTIMPDISPNDGCDACRVIAYAKRLEQEIKRLRLLIRSEQIEPPFDVEDDLTTEFAVQLAAAEQRIAALEADNERLRLLQRDLQQRPDRHCPTHGVVDYGHWCRDYNE